MVEKITDIKPLCDPPMTGENTRFCKPVFFLPFSREELKLEIPIFLSGWGYKIEKNI